jgi:predicted kinase
MRKWMTERLKRRKKTEEGVTKEATKAQEPLQPRFYDNEPAAAHEPHHESPRHEAVVPEAVAEAPAAQSRRPSRSRPAATVVSEAASEAALESAPEAPFEPASEKAAASAAGEPKPRTARRRRSRGGRGGSRSRPAVAASTAAAETSAAEPAAPEPAVAGKLPAQAAAPARPSKGTVVLAIGLPGSGKSSWFKRHSIHPLSSDLLRELLFDDAQEQRFQDLVFSNLRSMLKARLIARRPMNYVDATNLTPHDRSSWIKLAKDYGYDVQGVFFDVPLEVCLERHQRRGRAVPEDIMRKMAGKLKAPTFDEGFSKITVVRVKQKEEGAVSSS